MKGFWEGFTRTVGERNENQKTATKRWRSNNRERYLQGCAAYSKKWAAENREKRNEISRRYYETHKKKIIESKKLWQRQNRERVNAASRRHYAKKKAFASLPHCMSCESILKESNTIYCQWCVNTYKYENTK